MATTRATPGFKPWLAALLALLGAACGQSDETKAAKEGKAAASSQVTPSESPARVQLAAEEFDARYAALKAVEAQIPRGSFDPQAIIQKVGREPEALADWVRKNTFWVPYRGALRGATGVLLDRMGNSLDRSLLLAELLRTAGHSVRLARGAISAQAAQRLMEQMPSKPLIVPARNIAVLSDMEQRETQDYAGRLQLNPEWVSYALTRARTEYQAVTTQMSKRIAFQVPFLTDAVGAPAIPPDIASRAVASLADHWWVQLNDGTQWVDIDALLTNEQRDAAQVATVENFPFDKPAGQIPLDDTRAHEVILRVIVEQWKDGQLTEKVALEHAFRPSEVLGKEIVLQNVPLHWGIDASFLSASNRLEALKDGLLEQTEWLPYLTIGDAGFAQASVLDTGELNTNPGAGTAAREAGGVSDALSGDDSFGGDAEASPETYFTAEWIEYEIRVPGEQRDVIRRSVFDMLTDRSGSARTVGDPAPNLNRRLGRSLGLMGSTQILPMVSRLPRGYVLSQVTLDALRAQKFLFDLQGKVSDGDLQGSFDQIRLCPPTFRRLYELGMARFEWSEVASDVYLASPNILSYRRAARLNEAGQLVGVEGYDIVSNSVAVRLRTTNKPFDLRIGQGVADTNAESLLMGEGSSGAATLLGSNARAASWITIGKRGGSSPMDKDMPKHVQKSMTDALQAGYVVVAPRSANGPDGVNRWDWWRIDPKSGQTLGFSQQGWGGSETETATLGVGASMAAGAGSAALSGAITYVVCLEIIEVAKGPSASTAASDARSSTCKCVAVDVATGVGLGVAGGLLGGLKFGVITFIGVEALGKVVCGAMAHNDPAPEPPPPYRPPSDGLPPGAMPRPPGPTGPMGPPPELRFLD